MGQHRLGIVHSQRLMPQPAQRAQDAAGAAAQLQDLGGTRIGAASYNAAHATPRPAMMTGLGWWQHRPLVLALGLVWLAHIGLDQLPGYGLKYGGSFQHTHPGIPGRKRKPRDPRRLPHRSSASCFRCAFAR